MLTVVCPNAACAARCAVPDGAHGKPLRCSRCGQTFVVPAAAPAASGGTPTVVGRYQVRARLGAGAFGAVYRAYDPQLDREVALKMLRQETAASAKVVERFRREAKAAARMLHPNIVPVHDAGQHGDDFYIASAFIAGSTLSALIPEHGMEPRRAATLVAQLADALAYAHSQGVLHRDVKPDNCLVDESGRLFLTDFGLAGWREQEQSRMTKLGAVMGTPAYMAPEQARGDTVHVGPAADQYGAGVVLYELLTGRTPFEGPPAVVLYNVLSTPPPSPRKLRPDLDPALEAICLKGMAKAAEDRYPDAAAFAAALRGWVGDQSTLLGPGRETVVGGRQPAPTIAPAAAARKTTAPTGAARATVAGEARRTHAAPVARPAKARPAAKRRSLVPLLAAAAAVVLLALGGWAAWRWRKAPATEPQPDQQVQAGKHGNGKGGTTSPAGDRHGETKETPTSPKLAPGSKAEEWSRLATDKNDPDAQDQLGAAYLSGTAGAPHDEAEAVKWLLRSADQDNKGGLNDLGYCYLNGKGVAQDHDKAAALFRRSAAQGNPAAKVNLGFCYLHGLGVNKDPAQARAWLLKARYQEFTEGDKFLAEIPPGEAETQFLKDAENGNAEAQYRLGEAYLSGTGGVARDRELALRWLTRAADGNHPVAQYRLGFCYFVGDGVPADHRKAFELYKKSADQGCKEGQDAAGYCYLNGLGVDRDEKEGVRLLQLAVAQTYALAQFNLGVCYEEGRGGLPRDHAKALELWRAAADQGHPEAKKKLEEASKTGPKPLPPEAERLYLKDAEAGNVEAQFRLGMAYHQGRQGLKPDPERAAFWLGKAVAGGHVEANWHLGWLYARGQGVPQDAGKAVAMYRKASDGGFGFATLELAWCYRDGRGVTADPQEEFRLYGKAAEQGEPLALYHLGDCYADGKGVSKDAALARDYWKKAADKGITEARTVLDGLPADPAAPLPPRAERLYRKAADKGDVDARFQLACSYWYGSEGVAQDKPKAVALFQLAAEQGHAEAQATLALCYINGDGVAQSDALGAQWSRKAAEQKVVWAMRVQGWCYYYGRGVPADAKEAVRWLRPAADGGDAEAMFLLGNCYADGKGVAADRDEALRLWKRAAEKGNAEARKALEAVKP